jgi:hypothetical protein
VWCGVRLTDHATPEQKRRQDLLLEDYDSDTLMNNQLKEFHKDKKVRDPRKSWGGEGMDVLPRGRSTTFPVHSFFGTRQIMHTSNPLTYRRRRYGRA